MKRSSRALSSRLFSLTAVVSACAAVSLGASSLRAQTVIMDTMTGASPSIPTATRTFIGDPFAPANVAPGGPLTISMMDIVLVSASAATYQNLVLRVTFWDSYNGSAATVFSGPSLLQTFSFGANTLAANSAYTLTGLTFTTPVTLNGGGPYGVTFNWQGDTGAGLANTDNLTTAIRTGSAFAVGSIPLSAPNYGYYRNASGRTDFNFASTDSRQIGANSAAMFRLYTNAAPVPEPATNVLLMIGGLGGLLLWQQRRRA